MLDGSLVGERRLGKYSYGNDGIKGREEDLTQWLHEMGL